MSLKYLDDSIDRNGDSQSIITIIPIRITIKETALVKLMVIVK